MSGSILTIGYEGRTADEFVRILKAFQVEVLVDVRERPLSRKRGFAKSALARLLSGVGKSYRHMGALGSPKQLRAELHREGDYRRFFRQYKALMSTPEKAGAIEALTRLLQDGKKVCLMCFEKDAEMCHRKIVADAVKNKCPGLEVVNL